MRRALLALAVAAVVFASGFGISRLTASHTPAVHKPQQSLAQQVAAGVAKALREQAQQQAAAASCQTAPDGNTYDCGTP